MPIAQYALGKLFGAAPCRETPEGRSFLTFIVSVHKTMTFIVCGRFLPAFVGILFICSYVKNACLYSRHTLRQQGVVRSVKRIKRKKHYPKIISASIPNSDRSRRATFSVGSLLPLKYSLIREGLTFSIAASFF